MSKTSKTLSRNRVLSVFNTPYPFFGGVGRNSPTMVRGVDSSLQVLGPTEGSWGRFGGPSFNVEGCGFLLSGGSGRGPGAVLEGPEGRFPAPSLLIGFGVLGVRRVRSGGQFWGSWDGGHGGLGGSVWGVRKGGPRMGSEGACNEDLKLSGPGD